MERERKLPKKYVHIYHLSNDRKSDIFIICFVDFWVDHPTTSEIRRALSLHSPTNEGGIRMSEPALQVRMLGDFSMVYQGQTLPLKNSLATKAMGVLQLLLYRGEAGVAREALVDALFFDDSSSDPLNNLKVTVSNLRRILRKAGLPPEFTVRAKNLRYYFASPAPIRLDVTAFDEQLDNAAMADNEDEKLACLLEAEKLYAGDFLPHLAGIDWATVAAAHYRQRYFHCVKQLAEILKARDRWDELLTIATRAAAMHHLEEWQCLRIDCLMKTGQYQQAKEVYDQVIQELDEDFGAKPSDALVQRFHQLSRAGVVNYETVSEVFDQLQEDEPARGAYYCSYPSFIDVYRTCSRMLERTGLSAYLLLYWLTDSHGKTLEDPQKASVAAPKLKAAISHSLRRGDVFTQYGRDRFLVLLMGTNLKNCELVNQRIVNKYKEDAARGVSFLHALHAVGTTELDLDDSRIWHSAEGCP